ncbi:hypothetical protein [Streptomyces flavalbus]|uniref:Sensor domain-containing protein n=1 Tax=Streptomyces flavalbus TaxID=2665155 RepID=A0ABW2W9W4_9ACTN
MIRPPAAVAAAVVRVPVALVLPVAVVLGAGGCSGLGETAPARPVRVSPSPVSPAPRTSAPTAPATAPALSTGQARAALVTDADLGEPWVPTEGAASWRDGYLKARTSPGTPRDCQRLLDVLYTDELLGAPPRAVTGLDDAYTGAQLRYQVTTRRPADVDRTLAWLADMPERCGEFTATTASGGTERVQVYDAALPDAGDARQGLRLTVTPEAGEAGEPDEPDRPEGGAPLTLDVAAVRVGEDALALTNGGLDVVWSEITQAVAELGAERLAAVRKQGRAQV